VVSYPAGLAAPEAGAPAVDDTGRGPSQGSTAGSMERAARCDQHLRRAFSPLLAPPGTAAAAAPQHRRQQPRISRII